MKELVFVSLEAWDEIWRRNQFLCAGLLRRHPELRILFIEPPKDVSYALRRGRFGGLFAGRTRTVEGQPRLVCAQPLKLFPNALAWGRRANEWLARRHLRGMMKRLGFRQPLLWLNPHSAVHLARTVGAARVLYDITDDWSTTLLPAAELALIAAQDEQLCRTADAVIVCSEQLFRLKQPFTRALHLVPNGVDAAHYATAGAAAAGPRPVLGYTGTIHAERVDLALVAALAAALPEATIRLIGPSHLAPAEDARLRRLPNVELPGPLPYARLPQAMAEFNVCITPHLVTPFTESLNPIKLWEYLAAGKPIVSTNVAGFRDYPELVRIGRDHAGFIQACREALTENPSRLAERRAVAHGHSWESRVEQIEGILEPRPEAAACC